MTPILFYYVAYRVPPPSILITL